ncbi:E3 ubiquitin-protein ligase IRC20 KNAG_0I01380 [Huiozyma naganishii CBS 8797]|uniref:RING-type domain-containing protein n=1 Tax=Huiozyma naganishii (strain ATCC MYA-139 / BCRC 22969 / CBS 8797 / KCTC 17520 / NBRC 10181 / NCYC 3082 / Yp74L-3) TaxID=1071383 RepID=J7S2A7_HUIN7|nr:hypothetical protein KNAG_0I01380 [Kazachstania naganishii CBS 8797]CCK71927.1 hypothetical protein KNAG_0I01380 [Kazachstania naganishii CBS 8797]
MLRFISVDIPSGDVEFAVGLSELHSRGVDAGTDVQNKIVSPKRRLHLVSFQICVGTLKQAVDVDGVPVSLFLDAGRTLQVFIHDDLFCKIDLDNELVGDDVAMYLLELATWHSLQNKLRAQLTREEPPRKRVRLDDSTTKEQQRQLRQLQRKCKDLELTNIRLQYQGTAQGTFIISFDVSLIFKENQCNKFSVETNRFLDLLSSTHTHYLLESHEANSNFIQRLFLEQTVKHTNDILRDKLLPGDTVTNLNLKLLTFQRRSVQWLLDKERSAYKIDKPGQDSIDKDTILTFLNDRICYGYELLDSSVEENAMYWNRFTNFCLPYKYALGVFEDFHERGTLRVGAKGLLSEEMGLGKTIEVLALVLLNRRHLKNQTGKTYQNRERKVIHQTKTTLLICPNALLKQWVNEIETHTTQGSLSVFHYLGYNDVIERFGTSNITEIIVKLSQYDIIITTYNVINLELHYAQYNANIRSRRNQYTTPKYDYSSPLSLMEFWRIVLDEVQMLKSDNTQIAKCTSLLSRIHTWGVSGTPVQTVRDIQTIFSYLKIQPFAELNDIIMKLDMSLRKRSPSSEILRNGVRFSLQKLMSIFLKYDICIRHTKNDVAHQIHLPKQTNYIIPLEFNPIEWDNYLNLWNDFIADSHFGPNGENETNLSSIQLNQWLVRLRYLCCHAIIPENIADMFASKHGKSLRKNRKLNDMSKEDEQKSAVKNIDDVLKLMQVDAMDTLNSLYRENVQLQIKSAQVTMELDHDPEAGIALLCKVITGIMRDLENKFQIADVFSLDNEKSSNVKVRPYFDLLHQSYFFIGTGYYFLGSKKLELVDEENEKIKLLENGSPLKEYAEVYTPMEMAQIEKNQQAEKKNYDIAEKLRKKMLLERSEVVTETTNETRELFDKDESGKYSTTLDIIEFDGANDWSANHLVATVFKALRHMIQLLNKQAEQFNELTSNLSELLYKPITGEYDEENEDAKAEEYSNSLDDQDKIFAIFHCLEELLKNRAFAIQSEDEKIKINAKNAIVVDPTYSPYHQDLIKSLILVDNGTSLKSIFYDLRNSKIVVSSSKNNTKDLTESFEDYLLGYSEEIPRMMREMTSVKESLKRFNHIYNAKVEYFGQLQRISDSLVSLLQLEPTKLNSVLRSLKSNKRYDHNLKRINQIESRIKYLTNLSNLNKAIESEKVFNCSICLGIIHHGSIMKCGHFFCRDCIHSWLKNQRTCPICKREATSTELYNFKFKNHDNIDVPGPNINSKAATVITPPSSTEEKESARGKIAGTDTREDQDLLFADRYVRFPQMEDVSRINIKESFGAKLDFMVKLILFLKLQSETSDKAPPQILIYSQNFEFLKIISKILHLNHISYLSCLANSKSISATIDKFKTNNKITCLLLNVRALGAGLNLLNAKYIFLLDPIISHNEELQAMSRNNRIGQDSETYVMNFMIRDSVEESIFKYKCVLDETRKQRARNDVSDADEDEDGDSFEISENATEVVSEKHLWRCFFQK